VARHHDEVRTTKLVPDGGTELWARLQKKPKAKAEPRPMKQIGKVGKARQADRTTKLKAEPANHEGYRTCYLCQGWFKNVDLEHVRDASTSPALRHVGSNHRWSCRSCNSIKKRNGGI
jgi:hypothetical protein